MAPALSTIIYATSEWNGILVRPSSKDVMKKAIQGHPVQVNSGGDYINLYHVFERMQRADKTLRNMVLVRKQIGQSHWLVFVTNRRNTLPAVDLEPGYNPKRGRYKRYAEQLTNGETVIVENKAEAIKVRRAWQLYVHSESRRHLRSTIKQVPRTGKFGVAILERKG